jgi:DNA-directed RNA polymerase beta subunit
MIRPQDILQRVYRRPKQAATADPASVPANVDTLLAATEKLLAVSRGQAEPDERDSLEFRQVLTPAKLLAERITLDADKVRRHTMRRLAKARSLKPIGAGHFDSYANGLVVGNPLSTPLEETNPLHLVEQARRITQMGPGGLPSEDSITPESQNVSASIFGFLDPIAGPESSRIGVDTRLAWGARIGSDGRIYQRFKNRRSGRREWLSVADLHGRTVGLPD